MSITNLQIMVLTHSISTVMVRLKACEIFTLFQCKKARSNWYGGGGGGWGVDVKAVSLAAQGMRVVHIVWTKSTPSANNSAVYTLGKAHVPRLCSSSAVESSLEL